MACENVQYSIVFLLLVVPEGDSVDKLLLLGQSQVDKGHVLATTEAQVAHNGLEEGFAHTGAVAEPARDYGREDVLLLYAAGDAEELEYRVKVLDRVDSGGRVSLSYTLPDSIALCSSA